MSMQSYNWLLTPSFQGEFHFHAFREDEVRITKDAPRKEVMCIHAWKKQARSFENENYIFTSLPTNESDCFFEKKPDRPESKWGDWAVDDIY